MTNKMIKTYLAIYFGFDEKKSQYVLDKYKGKKLKDVEDIILIKLKGKV